MLSPSVTLLRRKCCSCCGPGHCPGVCGAGSRSAPMFLNVRDLPRHPAADNLPLCSCLMSPETGIVRYACPKQGDARTIEIGTENQSSCHWSDQACVPNRPVPVPACEATHIRCVWERRLPVGSRVGVGRASQDRTRAWMRFGGGVENLGRMLRWLETTKLGGHDRGEPDCSVRIDRSCSIRTRHA